MKAPVDITFNSNVIDFLLLTGCLSFHLRAFCPQGRLNGNEITNNDVRNYSLTSLSL